MDRRQFIGASAAALAASTLTAKGVLAAAQPYDLLIKGGQVIDPSLEINGLRDVAIAAGKIVAVEPSIGGPATQTLDARGKLVTPGLIDVHTHVGRDKSLPPIILKDGVTAWLDAGSRGADAIDQSAEIARTAPQLGRVLINIARTGIIDAGELMDIENARVDLCQGAIARHRDVVVGVKARLSTYIAGENDLEAVRRAQEAASAFGLPVMLHIGQSYSPLAAILALLKKGDIVTHMYAPGANGAFDKGGKILPEVLAARRRGIWFDFGNGTTEHFIWDTMQQGTSQGFWPDTISTDWTPTSPGNNVENLPNVMSKFFPFGLPVPHSVGCVTSRASRLFPSFEDRGTLNVGAEADVAILELRQGAFEFVDDRKAVRAGKQKLFPVATVVGGKVAAQKA